MISIIVPVYNVEKYLRKCIDSVLAQTYTDWELLLIDDGSTDSSGRICDEYAKTDDRIQVFHTENQGVSAARNIGLENVHGEWLTFIDSDDYIDNDFLEIVNKEICIHKVQMITWGNYYEDENNIEWQPQYIPENRIYNNTTEFINTRNYRHGGVWYMYQNQWIKKYNCKFPIGIRRSEDQCFLLQYLSHNPTIHSICRPFYHYVKRENSVCNTTYTIDDVKDNMAAATEFVKYAQQFSDIDYKFIFDSATKLFYDYFSYIEQINKLYDKQAQKIYTYYYKEICKYYPQFKQDKFLNNANYSIKFAFTLQKTKTDIIHVYQNMLKPFNSIKSLIHFRNTIENIVKVNLLQTNSNIDNINNQLYCNSQSTKTEIRRVLLQNYAINSQDKGVTDTPLCDHEVVVSLTTYRERIHEVYLTIESIMQGTVKPNRIILWLAEDEFTEEDLPIVLKKQRERGLEIRYCKDIRSYKKIIPTLRLCPEACIVTIDDDIIYEPDLLEHLIYSYKKYPNCVSACRTRILETEPNGMPLPYLEWKGGEHVKEPSHRNFLTGVGGNLFPPHLLHKEVMDENTFMTLAPTADDVWLNAMLLLNGVKVVKAFTHAPNGNDFIVHQSQYVTPLWDINKQENGNDPQIQAVWNRYKLYELINK